MMAPLVIETFGRVALLGVRFWDEVTQTTIGEGLIVTAYPSNRPDRRFALAVNGTNTYVLQYVQAPIEFGAGDQDYWDSLPALQTWVIEVNDAAGRFIPFSFEAAVPHRDLFLLACDSPLEVNRGVPLFSSPTRSISGNLGVIRADLRDATQFNTLLQQNPPAPGAVIEAWYDGKRIGRGLANEQGRIVIVIPYPEPLYPPVLSPLGPRIALTAQSWPVELRAFYSAVLSPLSPARQLPDLCAALTQSPATLLKTLSLPDPLTQVDIKYGIPAVLKTRDQSELLISP